MKTYTASRSPQGLTVIVERTDGSTYPLPHVSFHSPTGFECGYGGSRPADLAFSILADHCGETSRATPRLIRERSNALRCWKYHQAFKWAFVAPAPREGFSITSNVIAAWLKTQAQLAKEPA